jgi:hypothetical protein
MSPTYSTVRTVRPVAGSRVAALTARSQATGQLPHDHPYESYGIGRPPLVLSARPCLSQHLVVRPDERSGPMRHRSISVPGSSLELRSAPITRSAPIALPPPGGIKSAEISISCGMAVPAQGGPSQGGTSCGSSPSDAAPNWTCDQGRGPVPLRGRRTQRPTIGVAEHIRNDLRGHRSPDHLR